MKHWILAAATVVLINGVEAREHWGPPPACPQPKVDCCKPKCSPKPCAPKKCEPKPCCPKPCAPACDPCCPTVCFERGHPTSQCCTPRAYSEPARYELRCGWDVFLTANFIYWEAIQDGMTLAIPGEATISGAGVLTALTPSAVGFNVLKQENEYKPGFQVGIGWAGGRDDWAFYAEYTWLHGDTNVNSTARNPGVASIGGVALPQNGVWIPTSWIPDVYANSATTQITSKWEYKLDLVDAEISRPFYSGARFTIEPFFGLRGAWIRQHLDMTTRNVATAAVPANGVFRSATYHSNSAAVGPRIGMNGNWLLGYGFRFIGDAAASILYTHYDVHQNVGSPDTNVDTGVPFAVQTELEHYDVLRPNFDLSLGLGWGSYFGCRRFHWDLSATYDFSVFTGQNMMRYLADVTSDLTTGHVNGAPGDLYLQGLTIQTRFDF